MPSKELGHPPTIIQRITKYPHCVPSQGPHASDPSVAAVQQSPHHGGGAEVGAGEAGFTNTQQHFSSWAHPGQEVRGHEVEHVVGISRQGT